MSTAYLAFELHANTTTFGWMNAEGTYRDENTFDTSASRMIRHVAEVPASNTVCTLEAGPLAGSAARTLHEHVDKLIVCDPRENDSISDAIHKGDSPDTYELCRLLRLGGVKAVYQPEDDRRAVFKTAARHYLDLGDRARFADSFGDGRFALQGGLRGWAARARGDRPFAVDAARHVLDGFRPRGAGQAPLVVGMLDCGHPLR